MVEIVLCFLDVSVDLLQAFQVPHRRRKEQSENHVYVVGESLAPLLVVTNEVYHHVGLVIAHSDGHVALVNNTERHRGVRRTRAYLLHIGNT